MQKALRTDHIAHPEEIRTLAAACFEQMLLDFDSVQVQTIDSFLLTLLSGMASVLRMSTGMTTELDSDFIISRAVDKLLTVGMTPEVERLLKRYLHVQLDSERTWDVRAAIRDMGLKLYQNRCRCLRRNTR